MHKDVVVVGGVDNDCRRCDVGDGGDAVEHLGDGVVIDVLVGVVLGDTDEIHHTHRGAEAFVEGVVEELHRLQRSSEDGLDVDLLGDVEVAVEDVGERGIGDLAEAEVADAHGDGHGVAGDDTVERLEDGLGADVVVERREDELHSGGVVIVDNVAIAGVHGEGGDVEGVGEDVGDDEWRRHGEGVSLARGDEAVEVGYLGQVGAEVGVAYLHGACGVEAEVLNDDLGIDGLAVLRFYGLGDCYDAHVVTLGGAADVEVVDSTAFAEAGVVRRALRGGVDEAELELLVVVAGTALGGDVVAVVGVAGRGAVEDVVVVVVIPLPVREGILVDLDPVARIVEELKVDGATVDEVALETEGDGVGTYLRDVDDGAVEVADIASAACGDGGDGVGDPHVRLGVGHGDARLVGNAKLPHIACVLVVACGRIPVGERVEVVVHDERDGLEAVVLVADGVVVRTHVVGGGVPYLHGRGTEGEVVCRQRHNLAASRGEVAGPHEGAGGRRVDGVADEFVVDGGAVDGGATLVGHTEGDHDRQVVADEVATRRDELCDGEVGAGSLSVDEEQEIDHVALVASGGGQRVVAVVGDDNAHPHVAEGGGGLDSHGLCEQGVGFDDSGRNHILAHVEEGSVTVEVDICGHLAEATLVGVVGVGELQQQRVEGAAGEVEHRPFGVGEDTHIGVGAAERRQVKVDAVEGDAGEVHSRGGAGGEGRIGALRQGGEGIVEGYVVVGSGT